MNKIIGVLLTMIVLVTLISIPVYHLSNWRSPYFAPEEWPNNTTIIVSVYKDPVMNQGRARKSYMVVVKYKEKLYNIYINEKQYMLLEKGNRVIIEISESGRGLTIIKRLK